MNFRTVEKATGNQYTIFLKKYLDMIAFVPTFKKKKYKVKEKNQDIVRRALNCMKNIKKIY